MEDIRDIALQYNREELEARGGGMKDPLYDTFEPAFWEFKKQYYVAFMNSIKQQNADDPTDTVRVLNKYARSFNDALNVLANRTFRAVNYPDAPAAEALEAAMHVVPNNRIGEYRALIDQFRRNIFNLDRQAKAIISPTK